MIKTKMQIANLIIGSVVAMTCGALTYFFKRLIDENDKQHKSTTSHLGEISKRVTGIQATVTRLELSDVGSRIANGSGGPSHREELETIKRKVSKAIIGIHQVQKTIDEEIIPQIKDNKKNYGEVTWIKSEISSQNEKIGGLYNVLAKLVKNQKH